MPTKLTADFAYTDAELLALCREQIAKLLAGAKEVVFGSERYTREDLDRLYTLATHLEQRINYASNGPALNVGRLVRGLSA